VSKIPWGLVLALAALATVVTIVLSLGPGSERGASWPAIASVVLAGWAMFLSERWLQNYLWGLLAALVFTLHPYVLGWANAGEVLLWGEALGLVVLATNIASWRILFQKQFLPFAWTAIGLILVLGIGFAWSVDRRIRLDRLPDLRMGLVTASVTMGGLLLGSILACVKHKQWALCCGNISIAALLGILCPLLGLALAVGRFPVLINLSRASYGIVTWDDCVALLEATFLPQPDNRGDVGLMVTEMDRWGWAAILTLAMMVVGWWRSLRRGWKCWRGGKPPLAWVLTLFALVDLAGIILHPPPAAGIALLSFAPVAVLLNVFGFADLAQGLGERLILAPPHER
jgi:hypothetical protein